MTAPDFPEIMRLSPTQPDPVLIERAASMIRTGRLVAFPTETVYGLGANAFDADAVQRIFQVKGRPASDPLIVHVHDMTALQLVVEIVPPVVLDLAARFWPGPLTLILDRNSAVPPGVSSGLPTVAVRIPQHPVALALLKAANLPIAAPSANRFSRPSATSARDVIEDLGGGVDLVMDAGPTPIGVESTIVDLTQVPPVVLRPGGISIESLQRLLPAVTLMTRLLRKDETGIAAPGMLLKHYSPRAPLLLFRGDPDYVLAIMRERVHHLLAERHLVGLLIPDSERPGFSDLPVIVPFLGSDLDQISHHLFAAMRDLDRTGVDIILAHGFGQSGIGVALWDRLLRAAEGRVIECRGGEIV